jgi:amino acid transporter
MSLLRTVKTVLWSFIGIRKKSGYEEDLGKANPFAIIAVALGVVALFVVGLIVLVNWVVKN